MISCKVTLDILLHPVICQFTAIKALLIILYIGSKKNNLNVLLSGQVNAHVNSQSLLCRLYPKCIFPESDQNARVGTVS